MSKEGAYAAEKAERIKALKKAAGIGDRSLARKIVESELYDHNSSARFLLNQIAVMAMPDEDANYPEDAPEEYQRDKTGWCWLSQHKFALRIGTSESQVQRLITRFIKDGVVLPRYWRDENMTLHAEYKVVESVVDAFQRPSQNKDVVRPLRYKVKRQANKGSFSAKNQPLRVAPEVAEMDEE
jgi:hypothetical protein